jgi:hypothetical protein
MDNLLINLIIYKRLLLADQIKPNPLRGGDGKDGLSGDSPSSPGSPHERKLMGGLVRDGIKIGKLLSGIFLVYFT